MSYLDWAIRQFQSRDKFKNLEQTESDAIGLKGSVQPGGQPLLLAFMG